MLTKLENAFEAAIQQLARLRNKEITKFDRDVSQSIFWAGLRAMAHSDHNEDTYVVVSAPTGSGKSSYAQTFIKAYIEVVPEASVLYLVDRIQQAEDIYQGMSTLVGKEKVAVWNKAHDARASAETVKQEHGFVPERRFSVDDLASYPVVIATHQFYTGRRASKATIYQDKPRRITFVDEKAEGVSIFDVDTGLIKTVRDRLAQQLTSDLEHVPHLTRLHDYLEKIWQSASSKAPFDVIPQTADVDLRWFKCDKVNEYILSSDEQIRQVFGFGRALANGFAFLSRYDSYGNGARFVGYEMNMKLTPGTILLDATADIDGVSLIAENRHFMTVPQVDFRNLTITHIAPNLPKVDGCKRKRHTISEVTKQAKLARPYADWILDTIRQNSQPGEKVLAAVHKALLDHEYLPAHRDFDNPYDLEGRQVCFVHWGTGIGSNRWKDATAVFLFGEFHKPRRTMVATGLGLREEQATSNALRPYQSPNPKHGPLHALREGDLRRWMKQIAMRGNARNIDGDGVCGEQRLYVTGEFERLVRHKDRMFPGANLDCQGGPDIKERGMKALLSLFYNTDALEITTVELEELTGISFSKNGKRYRENVVFQQALQETGFRFEAGKGRGNPGRFVRLDGLATAA
jgi:hypothetical protein